MNWRDVASRDKALRGAVDNASEKLAQHRYENTIGAGVSFREYARKVGVSEQNVRNYARAWELAQSETVQSISDALVKTSTSAERYDVIEAVATARGVSPKAIQAHHGDEVRRIRHTARDYAEKRGTTVREEAEKMAKAVVRSETAAKSKRESRKSRTDFRFIELERHLHNARRALMAAAAVELELTDEYRDLVAESLTAVKTVLALVEMRFIDAAEVDWDAELAKLGE